MAVSIEGFACRKFTLEKTNTETDNKSFLQPPVSIRNFYLIPNFPIFNGHAVDNVELEQVSEICNLTDQETLAIVKLGISGEALHDTASKEACSHRALKIRHKERQCRKKQAACFTCGSKQNLAKDCQKSSSSINYEQLNENEVVRATNTSPRYDLCLLHQLTFLIAILKTWFFSITLRVNNATC
ncbi:hypothetical protein PR048_012819 [Dryococelus australis]|uniref:Uncharacterized protein n=1 Tax=Dryococelus australis TaxID=614101 RepID=A0ABQ9HQE4_9NEOP|nr:hypothetical protein PR048_012819 [Dryococelus australis]